MTFLCLTKVAPLCLLGRQVPQSGAKSTVIDGTTMAAPSLCSSTTVTTVFQQPIMSPAMPPLCLDSLSHPMAKRPQEEEEVRQLKEVKPSHSSELNCNSHRLMITPFS